MTETIWLGRILSIGGVLEVVTGLGLLVAPAAVVARLLGAPLVGPGVVMARVGGAGLLSLGMACWSARATPETPAGLGVTWAFVVYNLVVCVILARTRPALAAGGGLALGAAALHGALGAALLALLLGRG